MRSRPRGACSYLRLRIWDTEKTAMDLLRLNTYSLMHLDMGFETLKLRFEAEPREEALDLAPTGGRTSYAVSYSYQRFSDNFFTDFERRFSSQTMRRFLRQSLRRSVYHVIGLNRKGIHEKLPHPL